MTAYPPGLAQSLVLHMYSDSSWGTEAQPFGGHVLMLCNGAVPWGAKKVKATPDSTADTEMVVASRASKDTTSIRMVIEDMGARVQGPTALLIDCQAARDVIVKPGSTQCTKYFERSTLLVE